jgi:hypothetical protein
MWHPPYNWLDATGQGLPILNTVHVGLIPRGPYQGKVVFITWDIPPYGSPGANWGILDPDSAGPTSPQFFGTWIVPGGIPAHPEATCSGHAWTPDGRWFVVGGQVPNPNSPPVGFGSRKAWIYDPDVRSVSAQAPLEGAWQLQPLMQRARYYPTVILSQLSLAQAPYGEMIAAGGSADFLPVSTFWDDYEAFRPTQRQWPMQPGTWRPQLYPGPSATGPVGRFLFYPRLFLLPDGLMGLAAHVGTSTPQISSRALHPTTSPANWVQLGPRSVQPTQPVANYRGYGTAVLFPNLDNNYLNTVMNIGGSVGSWDAHPTTNVEWANLAHNVNDSWPNGYQWTAVPGPGTPPPPLNYARAECNAVLLPDATVLVLGDGRTTGTPVKTPELLRNGQWEILPDEASRRDHHAVALLLPSGRVLSAGGNNRSWDFQLYEPDYMVAGTLRPTWLTTIPGGVMNPSQQYTLSISLPAGTVVGKVVLMRPGSLTHHADMDQRYIELPFDTQGTADSVTITAPSGPPTFPRPPGYLPAPRGYYMMFLVSSSGVPSVAQFVQLP